MIGSLVNFFYGEHPDNVCVIVGEYGKEYNKFHEDNSDYENEEDETLFLVYDLKNKQYFYAMLNELSFVY
tara:strand:- start:436 stop:645 length:210 start_codon:yes stop_codon:yes gene_type:complete